MDAGFIKLPRGLRKQYGLKPNVWIVFTALIESAVFAEGWEDRRGFVLTRGQTKVTHASLAKECGISTSAARCAIDILADKGLITISVKSKNIADTMYNPKYYKGLRGTVITIVNFDKYSGRPPTARNPSANSEQFTRKAAHS